MTITNYLTDDIHQDIIIKDEQLIESLKGFNFNELDNNDWIEIARKTLSKHKLFIYKSLALFEDKDKNKPIYFVNYNEVHTLTDSGLFEKIEDEEECVHILAELAREDYERNKSYSLTLKFKKENDVKEKGVEND